MNTALSVFLKPITAEFDWSRSTFAGASTIGTILGGITALAIGPAIDRFGARWVLLGACTGTGALFLLLGTMNGIWQFYLILVGGRLILQGLLNVANNVVVSKWFVSQRGRASAIAALGPRLGTGTLPLVAQFITNGFGWRTAAATLGLVTLSIALIPVLLWLRRTPEDIGLVPDGVMAGVPGPAPTGASLVARVPATEAAYTLKQVLRFRGFYILLAGFVLSQFVSTGINFNLIPYFTDQGLSSAQAVIIVSVWSLIGVPTTLLGGYLAERVRLRYLLFGIFAGITLGALLLTFVDNFLLGLLFAVLHGSFFGSMLLFQTLAFADYYGRSSLGAIRGFITPFLMFSNALGPLVATAVFDTTGSYSIILRVYVGLSAVSALGMLFATPPSRRDPSP